MPDTPQPYKSPVHRRPRPKTTIYHSLTSYPRHHPAQDYQETNPSPLRSTPPHSSLEQTENWVTSMVTSPQNGITDFIVTLKQPPPTPIASSTSTPTSNISASTPDNTPLPIGKIGIYRPAPSNEIGFMISRTYWSQGLATEAKKCILDYLFSLGQGEGNDDAQAESEIPPQQSQTTASNPSITSATPDPQSYTTLSQLDQLSPWRYPRISADVDPRNEACKALLSRMGFQEIGFVERTDFIGGEWVDSVFYGLERERWIGR